LCHGKILFLWAKAIRPKYEEEPCKVIEIGFVVEDLVLVLQDVEDNCEEPLGAELDFIVPLWVPLGFDPLHEVPFQRPET
jgi:hypothetical protein